MKKKNNKHAERTKASLFDYFKVRELFRNCNNQEIVDCIVNNSIQPLLFLLMILDEFREEVECPIYITSSYRNAEHNKMAGGSETSQHMLGEAIDFYGTTIFWQFFVDKFLDFLRNSGYADKIGQVIIYNNFIHFACATSKHPKLQIYDKRECKTTN